MSSIRTIVVKFIQNIQTILYITVKIINFDERWKTKN